MSCLISHLARKVTRNSLCVSVGCTTCGCTDARTEIIVTLSPDILSSGVQEKLGWIDVQQLEKQCAEHVHRALLEINPQEFISIPGWKPFFALLRALYVHHDFRPVVKKAWDHAFDDCPEFWEEAFLTDPCEYVLGDHHRFANYFESAPIPDPEKLRKVFNKLTDNWEFLFQGRVARFTSPMKFTGRKKRRLLVEIDGDFSMQWVGTMRSAEFREFRMRVNDFIHPHRVDHIDFETASYVSGPHTNW